MQFTVMIAVGLATTVALSAGDPARIYVYAQRDTAARSWLPISCGSAVVADLKQGTFFAINLTSGQYELFVKDGVPVSVDVHSGEESFVRLDWEYEIGRPPVPVLVKVGQTEARSEMKYLSYVGAKRVHSSLVPKTDPSSPVQPKLRTRDQQ
jgi:hypothetical protein